MLEGNRNDLQGLRDLKLAAVLQAALGAGFTAMGTLGLWGFLILPVPHMDFQFFVYVSYSILGPAAMLIALPLARRARWAWLASWVLASILLALPFIDMISVYIGSGSFHGSEGSLLLLFAAVPVVPALCLLYSKGRSALVS